MNGNKLIQAVKFSLTWLETRLGNFQLDRAGKKNSRIKPDWQASVQTAGRPSDFGEER